jgi:hypothetical protein
MLLGEDGRKAVNNLFDAMFAVATLRNFAGMSFGLNQPTRSQADETQTLAS